MRESKEETRMVGLQKLYQMYQKVDGVKKLTFEEWLDQNNY